jgi:hypothetical protein
VECDRLTFDQVGTSNTLDRIDTGDQTETPWWQGEGEVVELDDDTYATSDPYIGNYNETRLTSYGTDLPCLYR